MKRHNIPTCLADIRASIDTIEEYLAKFMGERRDFNIYMQEKMLRNAVERQLEIIGEATKRILQTDPAFKLTNARKIIDLRNYVAHGYDVVDDDTIWIIVNKHLSPLRSEVEQMLEQFPLPKE